ncbi:hypothetical protein B0T20DRAFT_43302 [Sordaria brevicollis]|uniref:Methyltransferase type 11 domain-containing protein n=1 Tax=Sordaria brevicollis TaxID=83679 RepID=A0AAE0P9J5_SORBR|nr:hypothetical protein B0T20DRAFT_43302 [Sordaria brevicollis]
MSDLLILPSTTYRPPSPQGRRRMARTLNPIMEEPEQTDTETQQQQQTQKQEQRGHFNNLQNNNSSNWPVNQKIEQWLAPFSPLSDHFPTPRGLHFLAAPILPATPSCISSYRGPDTDADDTSSETSSSNPSSGAWNNKRSSAMTDVTEFDDLYDISDEETQRKEMLQANGIGRNMSSRRSLRRSSRASIGQRLSLSRLVIPADIQADAKKNMTSPIPPTPPSAIAMSPAVKSLMELRQIQEIPNVSAPPSLDGSINSEEMAAMSAPPTPLIGAQENVDEDWSGVRLQPGALETLQALSSNHESDYDETPAPEQVIEVPQQMSQEMSQARQLPRLMTGLNRAPSGQRRSLAELSRLEIPSPGGFFSELSSATRRTWNMGSQAEEPYPYQPPTSTTAENFYKTPWQNAPNTIPPPPPRPLHLDDGPANIVERVVEVPAGLNPEELPTAVRVEATPVTAVRMPAAEAEEPALEQIAEETFSPMAGNEIVANEIVDDYDAKYVAEQQSTSLSHIERTELWLMAQRAYLQGVVGFSDETEVPEHFKLGDEEPEAEVEVKVEEKVEEAKTEEPAQEAAVEADAKQKKSVRFSEITIKETVPKSLPSKLVRMENAFYRAFTDAAVKTCPNDVFVNRQPRFEALQAQRVALKDAHRNQLLGKFQLSVVPQSAKKRMSANVARGDDVLIDDPEKLRAEKEAEARSQMNMATWHVAATKLLNGGRLICAPVAKRLARQSRFAPGADGVSRDRARILDLAGQGACDWAWHCALQYPNTKIYTVTTKTLRQLSNSNIRGPPNHRQVAVERLTKLPFSDNQFDLISARELHAVLKLFGENGADEWEACLKECMRVLKPGGYLEFSVLDADIMNAGPLGNAKAVEFGFALQTLGYDPNPTRSFMARLRRAGFDDVRRAWMCMPMGPRHSTKPPAPPPKAETPGLPPVNMTLKKDSDSAIDLSSTEGPKTLELEAMVSGSTDNVAAIAGIAAGWSWERWLLRAEMEKAAGELRLADMVTPGEAMREAGKMIADVHAVVEEGRNVGSGFRMLRGYARKPSTSLQTMPRETRRQRAAAVEEESRVGFIDMVLDTDSLV